MDKIKSWPKNERPREKLLNQGASRLSDIELLAIFLRTGTKGKNSLQLAGELLQKFGSLRRLLMASPREFIEIKGLGQAKLAQLKAVLELSSRYLKENIQDKKWLDSAESVFHLLYQTMRDLDHELFKVIFLNAQNEVIIIEDISHGSLLHNSLCPRDIFARALEYRASGMIFVHNHPSGNPKPSRQDKKTTAEFLVICRLMRIRLLDHIIIGDNKYYSFAENGLL